MADEPQKVIVQASRIDDTMLPPIFSLAYRLYVIQQGGDLKKVADASNNANDLAYQATLKNEEQDLVLADHEVRIVSLRFDVDGHEVRITANEAAISALNIRVTTIEGSVENISSRLSTAESTISSQQTRITAAEGNISSIQSDYVSKSTTISQTLASPLNVASSYSINGSQVVGARVTGFTAATGTALKGAFAADNSYTIGTTYSQSQVQALATDLRAARQRIKALEDAMRSHGLIN